MRKLTEPKKYSELRTEIEKAYKKQKTFVNKELS